MSKIAIIEDDLGIVEVTKIILEEAGFEVLAIDNPKNIKELITKNMPDLMLMDIWIADQNGADLVRFFKSSPKTNNIPIIMVSAKQDAKKIADICGADDFLAKPFDIQELVDIVKKYTN